MSKEKEDYKTIKVKESTYKELKEMGQGISKAVETLVKDKKQEVEEQLKTIEEVGTNIANIMLDSGFFDIKFKGISINNVEEEGEDIRINGTVVLGIGHEGVRKSIIEALKPKGGEENA